MESVGGYRLVRRLGSGQRADVYLGFPLDDDPAGRSAHPPRSVAIKCYRHDADAADLAQSVDLELAVLARSSSPHIVRLLDLASPSVMGGPPCLILQRLNPAGLTRLLLDRPSLSAGQAVTVLAPVAGAIGQLHRAGFSHGQLTAANVLFDDSAAPVLIGFGRAGRFWDADSSSATAPSIHQRLADAGVVQDLKMLAGLTMSVLERVRSDAPAMNRRLMAASLEDMLSWLLAAVSRQPDDDFADQLAERLFDLAPALPLHPASDSQLASGAPRIPSRLELPPARSSEGDPAPRSSWLSGLLLPEWVQAVVEIGRSPARSGRLTRKVGILLTAIRRPLWLGVIAAGVVSALALIAIPAGRSDPGSSPRPWSGPGASSSSQPSPIRSSAAAAGGIASATAGDDPVSAVPGLLRTRTECLLRLSISCLEAADQAGSAAFGADQAVIRARQQGEGRSETVIAATGPVRMIDRMGDVALLGVGVDVRTHPAGTAVTILL
ncbi:MAG: protein kinase, partial [Microbacteriaceae bacterium]